MASDVQEESGGAKSAANPPKSKQRSSISTPAKPEGWHDDERNHRAKERTHWFAITILIFIAAGGAIATTILAFLALLDSQSAAVAARQAAAEVKRQADAAEQQTAIAKDNQARQLRAYIGFVPGGIENFGDKEKQIFRMTRKNYGLTPAYNVSQSVAVQEVIKTTGNVTRPLPLSVTSLPNNETVFPGMENLLRMAGNLNPPDDIAHVKTGTDYSYVIYGAVYYADAFGVRHYTRYCWIFKGPSMTKDDAVTCIGHNDSD